MKKSKMLLKTIMIKWIMMKMGIGFMIQANNLKLKMNCR